MEDILDSLIDCVEWCNLHSADLPAENSVAEVFRSEELKEAAQQTLSNIGGYGFTLLPSANEGILNLINLRRNLLKKLNVKGKTFTREMIKKELSRPQALFLTDLAGLLFDGAAEPASNGFIDERDIPPWDTWIALVEIPQSIGNKCLLSWVPPWGKDLIQGALFAQAVDNLSWGLYIPNIGITSIGWGKTWQNDTEIEYLTETLPDKSEIPNLIKRLKGESNPEVYEDRTFAARLLGKMGKDAEIALPALYEASEIICHGVNFEALYAIEKIIMSKQIK